MRNKIFALVIVFTILNTSVLATGVQTPPQTANQPTQSIIKTEPLKWTPRITQTDKPVPAPIQTDKTKFFSEQQANTQVPVEKDFEKLNPPFQIGTTEDVAKYVKISLPDAIIYALEHNPDIISTRLNVKIANNNIKIARHLKNPYIQFFLNAGKAATDNPNNVGLIFPIELFKRGARKNLAKSNLELIKGNVLLAELMLRLDVRQYYVDLVSAKSTLKILNDQKQLIQELVNIAQKKYEAGASPQMDVIQSKMTLNQLLIQVNSAKAEVLIARNKFNFLLESKNFDTKEDYLPEQKEFISMLTPNPSGKMPDFDSILNIAFEKRLDIKNARQEIDVARKNLVTVVRQRVPDIEIGGGPIFVPQQLSTADRNTYGLYAGGNITNIPLFYMYNPEIKNAKLQIEQKELAYERVKHQALMDLHSAYDDFITSQINLNYYNDVLLNESKQFLHMARRSYEIGKTSITDYIFIEQSYKNIMMGYINALSGYYDSWIGILKEVNDEELKLNG